MMYVQYMIRKFSKRTKNYFVSTASFFVYQWMQKSFEAKILQNDLFYKKNFKGGSFLLKILEQIT